MDIVKFRPEFAEEACKLIEEDLKEQTGFYYTDDQVANMLVMPGTLRLEAERGRKGDALVVTEGGDPDARLMGVGIVHYDDVIDVECLKLARLARFYTRFGEHGKGVGTRLLKVLEARANSRRLGLYADVPADPLALEFFENRGYTGRGKVRINLRTGSVVDEPRGDSSAAVFTRMAKLPLLTNIYV